MGKLSKADVANLGPHPRNPANDNFVWDDSTPGFGVKRSPSGHKSYVLIFNFDGKKRRYTIGTVCDALTIEQARSRARDLLAEVRSGRNPHGEKVSRRNALSVGDLLDKYLASAAFAEKSEATRATDRGRIERHIRPLLGNQTADRLTRDQIAKARQAIEGGKTATVEKTDKLRGKAVVTGGPGAARKSVILLRAIYGWAIREQLVKDNPAAGVQVDKDAEREIIIDETQYAALFDALDKLEQERRIASPAADAIRLIAFTGARRGEVIGLRWRHIDLEAGRIVISKGEHKTGRKTQTERIIGLSPEAIAILERQQRDDLEADDLVFTPSRGEAGIDLRRPWRAARTAANLPADFVMHGLRHSVGSHLAMAGANLPELKTALGHRSLQSVQRYIHFADKARQALATRAAAPIAKAFNRNKPTPTDSGNQ
jgi:integrase